MEAQENTLKQNELNRIDIFDHLFKKIENIRFYPFVGKNFIKSKKRIMIFAHNIPVKSSEFEKTTVEKKSTTHFTSELRQYVNSKKRWNQAFRKFVKASICLQSDYKLPLDDENKAKIINFIDRIAHINYINGLVESENQINVNISKALLSESIIINNQILEILDVSHIVCWGSKVFEYILKQENVKIIENWNAFERIDGLKSTNGFGFAKIQLNNRNYCILKTCHPSMPNFKQYEINTHNILNWFYNES